MSITLIYSREEKDHTFSFAKNRFLLIPLVLIFIFTMTTWFIHTYYKNQLVQFKITALNDNDLSKDKYLQLIEKQSQEKLIVLSRKLGEIEAKISTLNNLAERLVEKSKLPKEEFDFTGLSQMKKRQEYDTLSYSSLIDNSENVEQHLINKEKQLARLEIALNHRHLSSESKISGKPVEGKGAWISSRFGTRKDPFSGKTSNHRGVDIAGRVGMPLIATAAGIVTEAGKQRGYGLMIEVQHANGLSTRYAHATELTVNIGDLVSKGQQVAVMGNTGRSTGAHVHYEVLKNGRQINPEYYIYRTAG